MLSRVCLGNFKAARELDLPLAPLTLLAGLNGSGKSTVLQSLSAIRQTFQSGSGQARGLLLSGALVTLGKGIDVLSENAKEDSISLLVRESENDFSWICKALPDANELEFTEKPGGWPDFVKVDFQYLQADRIVPRTLFPQADEGARRAGFLGSHGEFTADFLARHSEDVVSESRRCDRGSVSDAMWAKIAPTSRLLDQVAGWLQQISPGARLNATPLKGTDEVILQFQYVGQERGLESNYYRPTNVGFGLTYSLPILVACLAAPKGALLLIENPEAHLHPQGQVKIGELLAMCAADGVQVLVETHSDHVLNGIRLAVKTKRLNEKDVRLCYFTRDVTSGECDVENPSILPDGQLTNWPEGFFDQWEKSLESLLSA